MLSGMCFAIFLGMGTLICLSVANCDPSHFSITPFVVLEATNAVAYAVTLCSCIGAIYLMRKSLDLNFDISRKRPNDELLDKVLLIIGAIGEKAYCVAVMGGAIFACEKGESLKRTRSHHFYRWRDAVEGDCMCYTVCSNGRSASSGVLAP